MAERDSRPLFRPRRPAETLPFPSGRVSSKPPIGRPDPPSHTTTAIAPFPPDGAFAPCQPSARRCPDAGAQPGGALRYDPLTGMLD
jgi:hypothetical protein